MERRRLYRIKEGAMISGVCRGIGEYFNIDETLVRLIWVIGSIFLGLGFLGLLTYIISACIIPVKDCV